MYPSRAGHVKPGLNQGGPSPKAKYSLASDSEKVARAKDEKNPGRGVKENLKPYAYELSEHHPHGVTSERGVTACLLHNDPASYCWWQVKALRAGAVGKPSLNRAYCHQR